MPATAADIHGPWVEPNWDSGVVGRLRQWWSVPVPDLPDVALTLFLRQQIAVELVLAEAHRRLDMGQPDDSELFEGQLAAVVQEAESLRDRDRNSP